MMTSQQGGANVGWNLREGTHLYTSSIGAQTGSTLTVRGSLKRTLLVRPYAA